MHLANQSSGKPDKLSQGAHKQTSYPRVQWGNTLDKKGKPQTPGVITTTRRTNQPINKTTRPESEGNARSRNNQEYRTTHAAGS